jgi:SAM-dependent methyltransferase
MATNNNLDQIQQPFPDKLVITAAECNKEPILNILLDNIIPASTPVSILEIGSGTGQHIVHFAAHFPLATFQPSDIDPNYLKSIQAYIDEYEINAFTKNVLSPISVDVLSSTTINNQSFDFIYCSNLIHITPIECTQGLFRLAEQVLKSEGSLITYGPYGLPDDGRITPESNRRFHAYLQKQDSKWGLRGINELAKIANDHHIELKQIFDMPVNNKILWWIKKKDLS